MQDSEIVVLYERRDQTAIDQTAKQYGAYLTKIAYNILGNTEDSREAVNDTYLAAWNSIPPHKPSILSSYLAKLTRRIAIDRARACSREKRRSTALAVSLSELEDCVSGNASVEEETENRRLEQAVNTYLRTLPYTARILFISRYFYADSLRDAAAYAKLSESNAKTVLFRTRQQLKTYLKQEGFDV